MRKRDKGPQLGLFDREEAPVVEITRGIEWPAATRFPLNVDRIHNVGVRVLADLRESSEPLLVLG